MLEDVYRVAPVPEDYMKYQLHMSTGMEVPQIEQWFQHRRSNDSSSQRPMEGLECIASILMIVILGDTHADLACIGLTCSKLSCSQAIDSN